jgi:hypothetical protein
MTDATLPDDFLKRLKMLLSDPALPQDGSDHTPGRDVQCEFYVYAICKKAGMSPAFEEPDVSCVSDSLKFGIAVKRVKGIGKFRDRLREAVHQIDRTSDRGIVFADVSVMLNPENDRINRPVTDASYRSAVVVILNNFIRGYHERLLGWFKGSKARGLILTYHDIRLHPTDGWEHNTSTIAVNLSPYNQSRSREFLEFFDDFKKGLATPAESSY